MIFETWHRTSTKQPLIVSARASRAIRGEDENSFAANTLRFAAGIGVGVGIGLLLAPASGEETRGAIAGQVRVVSDRVKKQFNSDDEFATGTNG